MRKGYATKGAFGHSQRGVSARASRVGHRRLREAIAKGDVPEIASLIAKNGGLGAPSPVARHFAAMDQVRKRRAK